ncbi:MAG TPA: pitrilysin family protein [Terriglobales bacterium]|nr:pitrilysin family protein [Terriglobales bacterium]
MTTLLTTTKRGILSLSAVLVAITFFSANAQLRAQSPPQPQPWQQIPIANLPAFHPPQPKRIELPNGMVIFLQEDHELPIIDGSARIRGGDRSVPANKTGLTDIYGEVWRTGGTKSQTGDQLDDYLEQRAAKVETGGGFDSTTISWSCLKEDFDDVFRVFQDVLKNPEFRAEKIAIAQKGMYDGIARRNDDASQIASREAAKLVYGANNPLARDAEYATVAAVTRQDLVEWHGNYVHPNNIILGVVGDFDSAKMEARLREAFASWPRGEAAASPAINPDPVKPGYYQVEKTDVNQSQIQMLALGITRKNPDYFALSVFNEAFGGGFSSRLFNDIRTTKGLAYGVGGGVGAGWDHPGMLRLMVSTKSKTTIESIQALDEEIADLARRPINDDEIKRAKDAILNSFVFRFDSPDKILQEKMAYEFYGYPLDFLETFQQKIETVTKEDVARVAAKYLHRNQMSVLVVGNAPDFDKPLSSLGAVTKLDITIPAPPQGIVPEQGDHP